MEGYIEVGSSYESLEQTLQDAFHVIFRDNQKYKSLLEFQREDAQSVVNALQAILNYQTCFIERRQDFLKLLLRLAKRSNCYPQCLALEGIEATGFVVAEGSFGEVRKGSVGGTGVCLKIVKIRHHDIQTSQKAFAKEAILWSHLSHPNVLPFYGIHYLNGELRRICLVSPWMENGNVGEYLRRFPSTNRLFLLKDIVRGLYYLHRRKIVHGDLKGANILVTLSGRACLADFGLSSMADTDVVRWTSLQSTANTGGTMRWQAPELIDPDIEVPTRKESDVYAFACVCYEIFTDKVPFYETDRIFAIGMKIYSGQKPSKPDLDMHNPQSVYHHGLTEEIWDLMQDCWRRDPAKRPSMRAVLKRFPTVGKDERPKQDWEMHQQFGASMQRNSNHFSINDIERVVSLLRGL